MIQSLTIHAILRSRQVWKAHFWLLQRQADFHPEINNTRLQNRTPDKVKSWRFFSWHLKSRCQPPSNFRELQPFEVTGIGVRDFAFQSQLSRCLVHTDCMMLDNTLLRGMGDKDIFAALIHLRTVPANMKSKLPIQVCNHPCHGGSKNWSDLNWFAKSTAGIWLVIIFKSKGSVYKEM